ncbi:hypothetical protein D3C80_1543330 [compost metagenome]
MWTDRHPSRSCSSASVAGRECDLQRSASTSQSSSKRSHCAAVASRRVNCCPSFSPSISQEARSSTSARNVSSNINDTPNCSRSGSCGASFRTPTGAGAGSGSGSGSGSGAVSIRSDGEPAISTTNRRTQESLSSKRISLSRNSLPASAGRELSIITTPPADLAVVVAP